MRFSHCGQRLHWQVGLGCCLRLLETHACFTSALWWSFRKHSHLGTSGFWRLLCFPLYWHCQWHGMPDSARETHLCLPSSVTGCHPSNPLPSPMVILDCSSRGCWFLCVSPRTSGGFFLTSLCSSTSQRNFQPAAENICC